MQERRTIEAYEQAWLTDMLSGEARQERGIEFGGDRLPSVEDLRPSPRFHREHEVEIGKLVDLARDERTTHRQTDDAVDLDDRGQHALKACPVPNRQGPQAAPEPRGLGCIEFDTVSRRAFDVHDDGVHCNWVERESSARVGGGPKIR